MAQGVVSPLPSTWLPDNASSQSRWIVLAGSGSEGISVTAGSYTFRMTVDLTGYNPATAEITGLQFAADDSLGGISINGANVYIPSSNGFNAFHFTPDVGLGSFQEGLNTIDFQVSNGSLSPLGFRADGLVVASVPDPTSLSFVGTIGLLACIRRPHCSDPSCTGAE